MNPNAPTSAVADGLILFAHGARDPRWAAPFEAIAGRIRADRPALAVRLAYLELMTPSLPDAGRELADAGCARITVQPLFLGAGGHVRRDLPPMVEALRAAHPQVTWTLLPPAGEQAAIIQALAQVTLEALGAAGSTTR